MRRFSPSLTTKLFGFGLISLFLGVESCPLQNFSKLLICFFLDNNDGAILSNSRSLGRIQTNARHWFHKFQKHFVNKISPGGTRLQLTAKDLAISLDDDRVILNLNQCVGVGTVFNLFIIFGNNMVHCTAL